MALRAALFDFGGTLLDLESDRRARAASYDALVRKLDLPMKGSEMFDAFSVLIEPAWAKADGAGLSLKELTRSAYFEVLPSLGLEPAEKDWAWFWAAYLSLHKQLLTPRPYAASVLTDAKGLGLHVGLLTDVDNDFLEMALGATNLKDRFTAITTSEEVRRTKPAKEMFLTAVQKAGCAPKQTVHIGDSVERDVRGAKAAGLRTVHYAEDACREADYCVATHQEVSKVLAELRGKA